MPDVDCTGPVPTPVPLSAAEQAATTRVSAGDATETRPTPATNPLAQRIRQSLLWYALTRTPHPQGIPDHNDLPYSDLASICRGLITDGVFSQRWEDAEMHAEKLRLVLAAGGVGTTAEAYAEAMLLDAINSCAPDREGDER